MTVDGGYVTIAQYAVLKGVSRQAVYRQLNNKLKEFVNVVDGKKVLSTNALTEEERAQVDRHVNNVEQQVTTLNQLVEVLQAELAAKDQQIGELHRLLAANQQIIQGQIEHIRLLEAPKQRDSFWRRLIGRVGR